ncbi:50S ribosomal protein L30 [archaeon SCG-AAA382B04]|nr:50S ribosomal protein L30 [archaeon SCG-AAA382B04]
MYAAIRVRGTVGIKQEIKDTLKLLNLNRPNHCNLIEQTSDNKGMLQKARNYITWGEINQEGLKHLLKRTNFKNNSLEQILEQKNLDSVEKLSSKILSGEIDYSELNPKQVIRLHPPRKGYKNTKRSYKEGGSLGYRGEEINQLIYRMR